MLLTFPVVAKEEQCQESVWAISSAQVPHLISSLVPPPSPPPFFPEKVTRTTELPYSPFITRTTLYYGGQCVASMTSFHS